MSCCCQGAELGASLAAERVAEWEFIGNSTSISAHGLPAPVPSGTPTLRTIAATDLLVSTRRLGYVSAALVNSIAGARTGIFNAQNGITTPGAGRFPGAGWRFMAEWAITDAVINPEAITSIGMVGGTGAPAVADPTAVSNSIGVGQRSGDTTLRVWGRDALGNVQIIDLGANFPCNVSGVQAFYRTVITCAPGQGSGITGRSYRVQVERLQTGHIFDQTLVGPATPNGGTQMAISLFRITGATNAAAVGLDLGVVRLEQQL
jgi:hypothetical protein